jgi:hypothetical protein
LIVIAGALSLGGGFPSETREIYDKAQCRLSYGRSVRVISVSLTLRVEICHRERLRGKVPAGVDCSDPWSWASAGYGVGAHGLDHDLGRYQAEAVNPTPTLDTPDQLGYLSCPAPCDAIAIQTFADFGDCLLCHNQPAAVAAWETVLGFPPVTGDQKAELCQSAIGRGMFRYTHKLFKLQTGCEFKREVSKDGFQNFECIDIDAPGHPLHKRMSRFRARIVDRISRRCPAATVALLDTCGSDGPSVGECTVAAVENWSAIVHPPTYPPLPPP